MTKKPYFIELRDWLDFLLDQKIKYGKKKIKSSVIQNFKAEWWTWEEENSTDNMKK